MKRFIYGLILGLILGTAITAYAATHYVWVNGTGVEIGTASNPVYITNV